MKNEKESGQGTVEYALVIGLISVIVIAVMLIIGPQIKSYIYDEVSPEETLTEGKEMISASLP